MNLDIKLMMTGHKTMGNRVYPRILFTGDWLIKLGFEIEALVSAIYEDGVLRLKAHGTGVEVYKLLVPEIRRKKGQLFQVLNTARSKGRHLDLAIDGSWLKDQGFQVGDPLVVRYTQRLIEIKKLDVHDLGFDKDDEFRLINVGKRTEHGRVFPRILLATSWLEEIGFHIGRLAKATYLDDGMNFTLCDQAEKIPRTARNMKQPPYVTIGYTKRTARPHKTVSSFSLTGSWLDELGYQVGDYLLLGIRKHQITLKQLDPQTLFAC